MKPLRTPHLWVLVPVGLAAGLGAYRLGAKSLWWDEAFSVWVARLDWPVAWRLMRTAEPNMMLYYVLLHFWLRLGLGEVTVRSLSTAAAVASIVPFYFLALRVLGPRYALLASSLLATNAFFIRYAQEARGYSLVLLLTTTSSLLFLRAIDRPTAWRWAAYSVASALAVYAHFFAAWVLAAQFVAAMLVRDPPGVRAQFVGAQAAVAAMVAPLAIFASRRSGALAWVPRPTLGSVVDFGDELTGYGGGGLTLVYLFLCAAFLLDDRRLQGNGAERNLGWQQSLMIAWLALPIVGSWAVSRLVTPIFYGRFLLVALTPLPLLAAGGVRALRPAWLKLGTLLVLAALAVNGLGAWYSRTKKEEWRAAVGYIMARAAPGDAIAFYPPGGRWPAEYYLELRRPGGIPLVPAFPSAPWGALEPDDPALTGEERFVDWWNGHPGARQHLWVVERLRMGKDRNAPPDPGIGYCIQHVQTFHRVRASRYGLAPCDARH